MTSSEQLQKVESILKNLDVVIDAASELETGDTYKIVELTQKMKDSLWFAKNDLVEMQKLFQKEQP